MAKKESKKLKKSELSSTEVWQRGVRGRIK